MTARVCPICQNAAGKQLHHDRMVFWVECEICGAYDVTTLLESILDALKDRSLMPYLSAATRQSVSRVELNVDNWQALAESKRGTPVDQKLRTLMELVGRATAAAGDWVQLDPAKICPLLAARDTGEFEFLAWHLQQAKYLERRTAGGTPDGDGGMRDTHHEFRLTVSGLNAVAPLAAGVSGTCFVAMSFDASLDSAYENGIMPSVETDCGFKVVRIDRVPHNDVITDKIIASIRAAQFVVADFTLQRAGVYYEAGFAQGLGRPVVWTCREDDKDRLHFDTRQFNHVLWTTPADLRAKLTDRIRATIRGAKLPI